MCKICETRQNQRRNFLTLTAAGVAGAMGLSAAPARAADKPKTTLSANDALARLQAGNATFAKTPALCAARLGEQRAQLATHQAPWATILSCADSRVPPELLFGGLGLGELFVARNAGHLADMATLGTIEYGSAVLGVPLIVVLGHESCGAVAAACEVVQKNTRFPGHIGPLVDAIVPAARAVVGQRGDFLDNAVRENARRTAKAITTRSKLMAEAVAQGKVRVVAAHYDLNSGKVEFLSAP
ncbi:Carbonic anhydrase 2 [compost metagenome]